MFDEPLDADEIPTAEELELQEWAALEAEEVEAAVVPEPEPEPAPEPVPEPEPEPAPEPEPEPVAAVPVVVFAPAYVAPRVTASDVIPVFPSGSPVQIAGYRSGRVVSQQGDQYTVEIPGVGRRTVHRTQLQRPHG